MFDESADIWVTFTSPHEQAVVPLLQHLILIVDFDYPCHLDYVLVLRNAPSTLTPHHGKIQLCMLWILHTMTNSYFLQTRWC